jgi:hypothetical protein
MRGFLLVTLVVFFVVGGFVSSTIAAIIPIEEEFVLAQFMHVYSSWDGIVFRLLDEDESLVDQQAIMHYSGEYSISQDLDGNPVGNYSGDLTGTYLGASWATHYEGSMTMASPDKKFSLISAGVWGRGPHTGKSYSDAGTVIEKENNKADISIRITTEGVDDPITITGENLDKHKDEEEKKLGLEGDVTVDDGKVMRLEKLVLILDQEKKTLENMAIISMKKKGMWVSLENPWPGTFTVPQEQEPGRVNFDITVTIIPEPATLGLLSLGWLALLRRQK